jgi:hypothetical protein
MPQQKITVKVNKEVHKRASTYVNLVGLVAAAVMQYFPSLGLSGTITGTVMILCNITVLLSQSLTFVTPGGEE